MSKPEHSPAPWTWDVEDLSIRCRYGKLADIKPHLGCLHDGRLIAAAPRMLAALKALMPDDFDAHAGDFTDDWHEARAAIREAEG